MFTLGLGRPLSWKEIKGNGKKIFITDYSFLRNGILLPNLFWPTARKNCFSDWEKLVKFEAEGREFAKFLRSIEQFIQTVKG